MYPPLPIDDRLMAIARLGSMMGGPEGGCIAIIGAMTFDIIADTPDSPFLINASISHYFERYYG